MKKRKKYIITAIVLSVLLIVGGACVSLSYYFSDAQQHRILKYNLDNSTENLMDVCNVLYINDDIRFLDYVGILIDRPDFKQVYEQNETNISWYQYNDLLILQAFTCVAKSDKPDLLKSTINEFFPKIQISEPLALLSYSLSKNPELATENKHIIIETLSDFYKLSPDNEKQRYLEYIVSYYSYFKIEDENAQYYKNELNFLMENSEDYEKRLCNIGVQFAESCWKCMFTGLYNEDIIKYFQVIF